MYFFKAILRLLSFAVACHSLSNLPILLPINDNVCHTLYETVVIRLVAINYFFTATTVLNIGGITVNIDNVPTSISSLVTVTQTSTVTATQTITATAPILPLGALTTLDFPFLITLSNGATPGTKRALSANFTDTSGVVTNDCQKGGSFTLSNGNLISQGQEVSINFATGAQTFGAKSPTGSISSTFYVFENIVMWSNSAFATGNASFCISNSQLFVIPDNVISSDCQVQVLSIESTSICNLMPSVSNSSSLPQSSLETLQFFSTTSDSTIITTSTATTITATSIINSASLTPSFTTPSSTAPPLSTTSSTACAPTAYIYEGIGGATSGSLSIILTLGTQVCGTGFLITNVCGTYMLSGVFYAVLFNPNETYGGPDFCFFPDNSQGSEIDLSGVAFETAIDVYSLYGFKGSIYLLSNSTNPAGEGDLAMPLTGAFTPIPCGSQLVCP